MHVRSWVLLLALTALVATTGCGGSSVGGGSTDADTAAGDVSLPDAGDPGRDVPDRDVKPLPDQADAGEPPDVARDAAPDAPEDAVRPDVADGGAPDAADGGDSVDAVDTSVSVDVDDVPEDVAEDVAAADVPVDASADVPPHVADVGEPCPDVSALLAEAKRWLEAAQPQQALVLYEEALALCPDDVEARFGAALAELVDTVELTLSLVSLLAQGDLVTAFLSVVPEESYDEWLAERLHWAFESLAERLRHALRRLDQLAAEEADIAFTVARLPVYNVTRPLLVYRGAFDRGDLHLMRLVSQNVLLVLDVLATQDFRTELMTLVSELEDLGFDGLSTVFYLLGRTLGGDAEFLTVHPTEGASAYYEAAGLLAALPDTLDAALTWLRAEGAGQGPQVSTLRAAGASEVLVVAAGVAIAPDGTVTETDLSFTIPPDLPTALARMADSVALPGTPVAWKQGPTWLLGTWLTVAIKLDLLSDLLADVVPIPLDFIDIPVAAGLLGELLPLPFAFDFGTLFARQPVGLRSFLPSPNDTHDGLVVDWECPAETADDGLPNGSAGLLCASATDDGPHFAGSVFETLADGHVSVFPYFGWTDPTFNGLLHVDLEAAGLSETPAWALADQTSLNAGLAVGFAPLLGLLSL